MKPPSRPPQLHLASSETEKTLVANADDRLRSVVAALEECRAYLIDGGSRETAQLLSVAILELRMKLNRVADTELKTLSDAMAQLEVLAENSSRRRSSALKLVT